MTVTELESYLILIKKDAGECNRYAADNLQKYINLTCGVTLPIITEGENCTKHVFSIGGTELFQRHTGDFGTRLNSSHLA